MDSNTTTVFPLADIAANLTDMAQHIAAFVALAFIVGLALVILNAVTSTKATTRPVRSYR